MESLRQAPVRLGLGEAVFGVHKHGLDDVCGRRIELYGGVALAQREEGGEMLADAVTIRAAEQGLADGHLIRPARL